MDWEKANQRLRFLMANGKRINSEDIIKRINKLNEWHRKMFIEYYDSFLKEQKISTFRTHRHPILEFLLQEKINAKFLSEITQNDLDDFLMNKMDNDKKIEMTTVDNNQSALKSYFAFHEKHLRFTPVYIEIKSEEKNLKNKVMPLTCEELENIRNIIKNEPPYIQFIFEFAYENGIRLENSRDYNMKNYDEENSRFISAAGEHIEISDRLKGIVERIKDTEEFRNPYYKQGFSKLVLYEILKKNGFERKIKSSDVNETLKRSTTLKCPGCGNVYEATAENWIIKQYHEGGQLWIVCKEKCGERLEDIRTKQDSTSL